MLATMIDHPNKYVQNSAVHTYLMMMMMVMMMMSGCRHMPACHSACVEVKNLVPFFHHRFLVWNSYWQHFQAMCLQYILLDGNRHILLWPSWKRIRKVTPRARLPCPATASLVRKTIVVTKNTLNFEHQKSASHCHGRLSCSLLTQWCHIDVFEFKISVAIQLGNNVQSFVFL